MNFVIITLAFFLQLASAAKETDAAYQRLLHDARHAMFNEDFDAADRKALAARELRKDDAESYEVRTFSAIFMLKKKLGISGEDHSKDPRKLHEHRADIAQLEKELDTGLALARINLRQNPTDERLLFLVGKLDLNKLMFILQILHKKSGRKEYLEAREIMNDILLRNPDHCRALTASSWMNYIVGTRGFFERIGLSLIGVSGDKQQGIDEIRYAAEVSATCSSIDKTESRFSWLEVLRKEQRWREVYMLAEELSAKFPGNAPLKKHLESAGKKLGK